MKEHIAACVQIAVKPNDIKYNIEKTAALAVKIAKSSAKLKRFDIKLADEPIHKDEWNSAYIIDPFKVPLEKKIGLLMSIDKTLRSDNRIKIARGDFLPTPVPPIPTSVVRRRTLSLGFA